MMSLWRWLLLGLVLIVVSGCAAASASHRSQGSGAMVEERWDARYLGGT